jgi:FkbM family methyltransferase
VNLDFIRQVGGARFCGRFVYRQILKRVFNAGVQTRLSNGLKLYSPPWSPSGSETFYTQGAMDWGAEALLCKHLDPAGVFIDVGAHIGYYSMTVANDVRKVYAFEPNPISIEALRFNASRCGNVEVVPLAVFSRVGQFAEITGQYNGASFLGDEAEGGLKATTIDDWMKGRSERVTAIKVDVDGCDIEVIKGAGDVVQRDQPLILTEFDTGQGFNTIDEIARWLTDKSYAAYAYCRTKNAGRHVFRRLDERGLRREHTKMIFLVPPRLGLAFDAIADAST